MFLSPQSATRLSRFEPSVEPTKIQPKHSMAFGFAGAENPLFFNENTSTIFGDAKQTL
jgi:NAD/NADP transhydrogenase beta subunit